ncbi:MAG: DUF1624 domain-containing protein [Anaerotruncus sp.]|nr:MAG: DUF1624 domain-containing protein [Anaerotruncus sp.]
MKNGIRRIYFLDELRGFAIICMVFHHMFYDIGFVLKLDWGYRIFDFLCYFQPLFWGIFIITSGICSHLSRNTVKRGFIVLACGAAVSIVTAVIMPAIGIEGAEIYFGILSCLGCCMIIGGLLQRPLKKCPAGIGMLICVLLFILTYSVSARSLLFGLIKLPDSLYKSNLLCPLGFFGNDFFSADYFPLLPWLFMFLTGSFIGRYAEAGAFPEALYKKPLQIPAKSGQKTAFDLPFCTSPRFMR